MLFNDCPNCEDVASLCLCTIAEKLAAMEIRRQRDREWRRQRGKSVLVDHTRETTDGES